MNGVAGYTSMIIVPSSGLVACQLQVSHEWSDNNDYCPFSNTGFLSVAGVTRVEWQDIRQ